MTYLATDLDGIVGHGLGRGVVLAILAEIAVVDLGRRLEDLLRVLLVVILSLVDDIHLLVALVGARSGRGRLLHGLGLGGGGGGHLRLLVHDGVAHVDDEWRCAGGGIAEMGGSGGSIN
jgi:hypothetical protein